MMGNERKREDFFVMSDSANSHYAFKYWLEKRDFNQYEIGKPDKRGNPLIKLINRQSDNRFSKEGIVCCLKGSMDDAEHMIRVHLERKGNDG